MKEMIKDLIKEYEEKFNKEIPMSILMHNEETVIKLLKKELNK